MRIIFVLLSAACLLPFSLYAGQIHEKEASGSDLTERVSVIVNPENPVQRLSPEQLKGIFTGRIKYWSEVGGDDSLIRPLIARQSSETRALFRKDVLGSDDYTRCTVISPDSRIVTTVSRDARAIGHIKSEFIKGDTAVKAVSISPFTP